MSRPAMYTTRQVKKTTNHTNGGLPILLPPGHSPLQRDEHLVSAARAGSGDAFAELQNMYEQRLYKTILRITRNHEDAEDALQDTFLRAFTALCDFEGRSSFYSWVTRIAINSALMVLRKRRARPEVSFDLQVDDTRDVLHLEIKDTSLNPEQIYCARQQRVRMLRSIQNLQPKLQEAIQIHLTGGYSRKEIAQTLGISLASVKSRLYRARVRLGAERHAVHPLGKRQVSWGTQRDAVIPSSSRSRLPAQGLQSRSVSQ